MCVCMCQRGLEQQEWEFVGLKPDKSRAVHQNIVGLPITMLEKCNDIKYKLPQTQPATCVF